MGKLTLWLVNWAPPVRKRAVHQKSLLLSISSAWLLEFLFWYRNEEKDITKGVSNLST
jgi:hypothetical protein